MELAKKIFSGVVSKFNNRQEKPQLTILIFFIIGVLLILSMYFIERDPVGILFIFYFTSAFWFK